MKSGTISLYYKKDECIVVKQYVCQTIRNKIIAEWKKQYGKRFDECYIQIAPDTKDNVWENGRNKIVRQEMFTKKKQLTFQ